MELNFNEEITSEKQNQSFLFNKYTSQALYQTLRMTKMKFERLLVEHVFKNPQFESVIIFFKFVHPCLLLYLLCY